jgi:hypothetical protein
MDIIILATAEATRHSLFKDAPWSPEKQIELAYVGGYVLERCN